MMSDLNIIKLAVLTVGLQAILVLVSFLIYYGHEKISKRNLLHRKKEINKGMIYDKEVEIEASWILLKQAEGKMKEVKETIERNKKEIEEEKKKTPMDVEKIKDLVSKQGKLGYTGKFKDSKPQYDPKGTISRIDNEIESHHSNIIKAVMEREYLKVQLQAINRLIKKGYAKNFGKFEEKELQRKVLENLKKK